MQRNGHQSWRSRVTGQSLASPMSVEKRCRNCHDGRGQQPVRKPCQARANPAFDGVWPPAGRLNGRRRLLLDCHRSVLRVGLPEAEAKG